MHIKNIYDIFIIISLFLIFSQEAWEQINRFQFEIIRTTLQNWKFLSVISRESFSNNNNNGGGIQMTNVLPFVWNKMIDKNVHQH